MENNSINKLYEKYLLSGDIDEKWGIIDMLVGYASYAKKHAGKNGVGPDFPYDIEFYVGKILEINDMETNKNYGDFLEKQVLQNNIVSTFHIEHMFEEKLRPQDNNIRGYILDGISYYTYHIYYGKLTSLLGNEQTYENIKKAITDINEEMKKELGNIVR